MPSCRLTHGRWVLLSAGWRFAVGVHTQQWVVVTGSLTPPLGWDCDRRRSNPVVAGSRRRGPLPLRWAPVGVGVPTQW